MKLSSLNADVKLMNILSFENSLRQILFHLESSLHLEHIIAENIL